MSDGTTTTPSTACTGCRNLRYRPTQLDEPTAVLPAWSAPGTFVCDVYGTLGPASHAPIPRTRTCKEQS